MIYLMKNVTPYPIKVLCKGTVPPGEVLAVDSERRKKHLTEAGFQCIDSVKFEATDLRTAGESLNLVQAAEKKTTRKPKKTKSETSADDEAVSAKPVYTYNIFQED